jgi:hypothetical protein
MRSAENGLSSASSSSFSTGSKPKEPALIWHKEIVQVDAWDSKEGRDLARQRRFSYAVVPVDPNYP